MYDDRCHFESVVELCFANVHKIPAPAYNPQPVEKLPPQPYQFEYGVADQYSGTNFQSVENQDEKGTVIGKWSSQNKNDVPKLLQNFISKWKIIFTFK